MDIYAGDICVSIFVPFGCLKCSQLFPRQILKNERRNEMMVMVMEKRSAVKVKSLASRKIAFNIESEKRFARLVTIPLVTK